jgi:hypothetical protein
MAFERHQYSDAAKATTLTADITNSDSTFAVTDASTWPTGGASGKVVATIDRDLPTEERIRYGSRTGNTLNSVERGYGGTAAQPHSAGVDIEHTFSAVEADEANQHITQVGLDHHTQYMKTDGTRHDLTARHAFGAALGTPGTPTTIIPDATAAPGGGAAPARENHTHGIASGVAVTITGTNAEGTSSGFARDDHNHALGADTVGTSQIIADSVGSSELMAGAIDDENLFSAALSPIIVSATNPGAVGANRLWYNTTKDALLKRNAADSNWEVMLDMSTGTDYTPTLSNISIGTGGVNDGRYRRVGRSIVADGFVRIGTGGNVTGRIGVGLPVAAANLSADYDNDFFFHGAGRASDDSTGLAYGGVGIIGVSDAGTFDVNKFDFITTAGGAAWTGTIPFNWTTSDRFSWFCEYVAASKEDANYV